MLSHQKSIARGNAAINTYRLHYYKQPDFLYANRAEGIKTGTAAHTGKVIFYAKLLKDNKVLNDNVYYFVPAKAMTLPDPHTRLPLPAIKEQPKVMSLKDAYKDHYA